MENDLFFEKLEWNCMQDQMYGDYNDDGETEAEYYGI